MSNISRWPNWYIRADHLAWQKLPKWAQHLINEARVSVCFLPETSGEWAKHPGAMMRIERAEDGRHLLTVNEGLETCDTAMVAGILAHEWAHVCLFHLETRAVRLTCGRSISGPVWDAIQDHQNCAADYLTAKWGLDSRSWRDRPVYPQLPAEDPAHVRMPTAKEACGYG